MLKHHITTMLNNKYFTVWIHLQLSLEPAITVLNVNVQAQFPTNLVLKLYHQGTWLHTTSADIVTVLAPSLLKLQDPSIGSAELLQSIWKTSDITRDTTLQNETSSKSPSSTTQTT
jgi:hypothetical protein